MSATSRRTRDSEVTAANSLDEFPSMKHVFLPDPLPASGTFELDFGSLRLSAMMQDFPEEGKGSGAFLVGFTAALSSRSEKAPPYFTGGPMAQRLRLPLLSFSDPALDLDPDLLLAFYGGDQRLPDLPARLANVIDAVAIRYGMRPVLFGGSGAGFASLNVLRFMEVDADALVWNPQTAIEAYGPEAVSHYLRAAFPRDFPASGLGEEWSVEGAGAFMDRMGLSHQVRASGIRGQVIYLQNFRDRFHFERHCRPFAASVAWDRLGPRSFLVRRGTAALFVGDWGQGHAVPPLPMIEHGVRSLAEGAGAAGVVREIERRYGADLPPLTHFEADRLTRAVLRPEVVRGPDGIGIRVNGPDNAPFPAPAFAFYLHAGPEVIAQLHYGPEPGGCFADPGDENLEVRAVARDDFGRLLSRTVAVKSI